MRIATLITAIGTVLICGCIAAPPPAPAPQAKLIVKTTPLILEQNEGERRTWRGWPGHPNPGSTFFLKVDPERAGSQHLVFGTEEMAPGDMISTHKHPGSDEILYLQTGTARVHLGDVVRTVHRGATVFIPAGTWISVSSTGKDVLRLVFVFSAPGFENFMRAESVLEGEKNTPVSKADDDKIQHEHSHDVIYK
jgi:mannose-6-phosphate isomerase-like protein (cupin superfamily)